MQEKEVHDAGSVLQKSGSKMEFSMYSVQLRSALALNTCGGRETAEDWQKENLSYSAEHPYCFGQPHRTSELLHIGPKQLDRYTSSFHQP